jgi:hypothetical protein
MMLGALSAPVRPVHAKVAALQQAHARRGGLTGRLSRVSISGDREVWFDAQHGGDDDESVNAEKSAAAAAARDSDTAAAASGDHPCCYLGPVTVSVCDGAETVETTGAVLRHSHVFSELLSSEMYDGTAVPALEMPALDREELETALGLMAALGDARAAGATTADAGEACCSLPAAAARALGHIDNWLDLVSVTRAASYLDARDLLDAIRWRLADATATLHGISHRTGPGWIPRSTADSILLAFGIDKPFSLLTELRLMADHAFLRDPEPLRLLDFYGCTEEDVPDEFQSLLV